jgi:hypothetical protein
MNKVKHLVCFFVVVRFQYFPRRQSFDIKSTGIYLIFFLNTNFLTDNIGFILFQNTTHNVTPPTGTPLFLRLVCT